MKVAIVYDRVNKIGGAERVLQSLFELFPKATLFTSIYNKEKTPWAAKFKIRTSFLQKIPLLNSRHELIPYLMPLAFENFDFSEFKLVISVTSEAAKGVIVPSNVPHVCICLTPTRYLWSGYNEYFKNIVLRILAKPFVSYLKKWDISASKRPDTMIAISENVRKRIKKYYKRESFVIYPPGDRLFRKKLKKVKIDRKDYFLVVSRLVDYKRIDLAVKACTKLNFPLIVIGEGNEWEKLDALSGKSIEFKGKVSDSELIAYYRNCKALIFPGVEDFGITMVEANLAGKPVIAYNAGGALEIVKKGTTGVFFERQTVASLIDVLKKFKSSRYNSYDCRMNANRFSEKKFKKSINRFLIKNKYI
jgi:glycosyltransferase involved in cell wall biosynthesis